MKALENSEKIAAVKERARKNFSKGFNCAECILEAVLAYVDTDLPEGVLKLATGFGGGVGLYGDTCGAITGAVMAVGVVHGRERLSEGEDRKAVAKASTKQLYDKPGLYRIFNQLPNRVKEKYGNTLCREICSQWREQWLCREHALHCREIITDIAEFAAALIYEETETAASRPFGHNVEGLTDDEPCDVKG